ncbi:MAG: ABC transporter substrate-binding protein [Polyangiaceae bacterium]|nr:ABC transporter substrate-binding protein [Polyangiaceae bacterium]
MNQRPLALLLTLLVLGAGCRGSEATHEQGVLVVVQEQQPSWIRNFNPLLPSRSARWPTVAGIHEPMMFFNNVKARWEPWLATSFAWGKTYRALRFELRDQVKWSDGEPFTVRDVVFTFQLLRKHPALDLCSVWRFLDDVKADGPRAVLFEFGRPYVPGMRYLAQQPLVPEHIWKNVADPLRFANENPVGTGPFTEVRLFRDQVWELGRNPHYWQPGRPALKALRFPAFSSNDQAILALLHDEVDWSGNFIPAIDRIYVKKDPEHHRYWFPLIAPTVFLYPNNTRAPLDRPDVRKALSMAIDRELLVRVALYDLTKPSDATGLHDAYRAWKNPDAVAQGDWIRFDPARAQTLLDAEGLGRGEDGLRTDGRGKPLALTVSVVSGWSDWVRAAQVIARALRAVGIDAKVKTQDFGAWFESMQKGEFDLAVAWSEDDVTPYGFYRWLMSTETMRPIGQASPANWHRYGSAEVDALLRAFEVSDDEVAQHHASDALQLHFVQYVPAIPLFPNPAWASFNTKRFVGFPSESDPYGAPSPNLEPGYLLALTRIRPRGSP